jgi:DNA-binding winged helix-turn-helix (wHTH) protein/Tol biopolymer transport system component
VSDGFVTAPKSSVFKFEDVEVREGEFLLIKGTEAVPVEPKAFRVLIYLLQNPGRVVTKEEILESVWNDCAVSDNSLTRSIATLRRLLRDDTHEPHYIATVPTVGYRFLCAVKVTDEAGQLELAPTEIVGITDQSRSRRRVSRLAIGVTAFTALALAALVFILVAHRQRHQLPTYGPESRLTASSKETPVTSSSISPDAKYLAYTDRTGLFVRQLEGGETNHLSLPQSLGSVRVESWFPDSAHLLVSSWDGGPHDPQSLWKVSLAAATPPRKLVENGELARVSPDGALIAFLRVADSRTEVWTIHPDTAEAHQVMTTSATEEEYLSAAAWAPDSRRFAYVRTTVHQDGGERKIETIDIATRKVELVLSDPNVRQWLVWTEKSSLVYSRFDGTPNQKDMNLWQVQLDPQTDKKRAKSQITSGHGFLIELSASSDGKVLAFRRVEPQGDVYIAELRQGKLLSAPARLTRENWEDDASSWTRDSDAVLFTSDRDGHQHIYRQDIDQLAPILLVGGEHDLGFPRISPEGSDMLYLQYPRQAEASRDVQIRTIPLLGGTSRLLLQAPGIWNHECARLPSSVCIYSSGFQKDLRLYSFDSKTGAKTELSSSKFKSTLWDNWSLSPDGKYLAGFKPVPLHDVVIRIISLQDESEKSISLPGWIGLNGMDWAADGMSFWVSACTQHSSLWGAPNTCTLVNAGLNGRITPLIDGRDIHFFAAMPSPNGDRLALEGETADNSNVWIVRADQ